MSQTLADIPNLFPTARCLFLQVCSWETYEHLLEDIERSGRRLRLTYFDGALEIRVPGDLHETIKTFVRAMLEVYLMESDIEHLPMGSTTWKRRAKDVGIEPDECYYVKNAVEVGMGFDIDLERDPPPDVAIEVEDTTSPLPKLPVYAALGVPEVWHIKADGSIALLSLQQGSYVRVSQSRQVPYFDDDLLARWLMIRSQSTYFNAVRAFRREVASSR